MKRKRCEAEVAEEEVIGAMQGDTRAGPRLPVRFFRSLNLLSGLSAQLLQLNVNSEAHLPHHFYTELMTHGQGYYILRVECELERIRKMPESTGTVLNERRYDYN
jgi:hypothetical protein